MNLTGRMVLIVEDEIIVAFALEDMLLDLGAQVLIASTIEQGMSCVGDADLALAVLDVNVNGIKSYGIAEELQRRAVPVIFATGYGSAEHPEQFAHTSTLTKPYTRGQLCEAIENLP